MTKKILLKDILFNESKISRIATEIQSHYPAFNKTHFIRETLAEFPKLELKARITWIADRLKKYLPKDFSKAVEILTRSLPAPCDPKGFDNDFGEFIYAPYSEYIAKNGCSREQLVKSLSALKEITTRFSVEDAIRYFINAFPKETLAEISRWSKHPHYHVRRLASEGTRPKLPWSQKIKIPITAPLPILDNLFFDKTRFVTRSVANHMNDLSKTNPELAIDTLTRWKKSDKQKPEEMDYIIRHAIRTMIKQGHPKALRLIGIAHAPNLKAADLNIPKKVKMNSPLQFSFKILSKKNQKLIVDYILHFQNKAGKLSGKKVFKLKTATVKANQPLTIEGRHPLRQFMTTRTLYPGRHKIEIQINGKIYNEAYFDLR